GGAQGPVRQPQARLRRHPRDRVHRAAHPADPRRPRTVLARARPAARAGRLRGARPHSRRARKALREAYVFLRRLENRVQMLRDAQTHDIPDDALSRERIAFGLDWPAWEPLAAELAQHREIVATEFAAVLMPQGGRGARVPAAD